MKPRIREAADAFRRLGLEATAVAVAKELGVTKQRAGQLLHRAADAGIIVYEPRPTIRKSDARGALREAGTIAGAARTLGISARKFTALFPDLVEIVKAKRAASIDDDAASRARIAYLAKRRAKAKRDGTCTTCYQRRARKGFASCATCAEAERERSRARALGKRTSAPK